MCTCLGLRCLLLLSLAGTSSGSAQHNLLWGWKLVDTTRDAVLTVYKSVKKSKQVEQESEQQRSIIMILILDISNMQADVAQYLLVLDGGQV